MLVLIARNCIKIFSELSVKKYLVLFFVDFGKVKIFFSNFGFLIFSLNQLSYISHAKSVLRLFKCFLLIILYKNWKQLLRA